jgi:phage shock protein A
MTYLKISIYKASNFASHMECWDVGIYETKVKKEIFESSKFPLDPSFHYSIIPALQLRSKAEPIRKEKKIMGIFTRIVRICKADIHGVMDQLEDQGLLLKQYLRDMEKALFQKEARLKKMVTSRRQAQQEQKKYNQEIEKIEQDLTAAIQKDKDDIARLLIRKLKPMTDHKDELQRHTEVLDQEIVQLQESVEKQRLQYEQFQLKSREFAHKAEQQEWETRLSSIIPNSITKEIPEEEVELELLQRKEAVKGGEKT